MTADAADRESFSFVLNGTPVEAFAAPLGSAAEVLRGLGMYGVRETCGIGVCGSCTVVVDGRPVSSCILPAFSLEGCTVLTVEGLADGSQLSALQRQFIESQAFQCSFCTPGFLLSAHAFLSSHQGPMTEEDLEESLSGHLCRCGCYVAIKEAVRACASRCGLATGVAQ